MLPTGPASFLRRAPPSAWSTMARPWVSVAGHMQLAPECLRARFLTADRTPVCTDGRRLRDAIAALAARFELLADRCSTSTIS
jgi:hypothetical protein